MWQARHHHRVLCVLLWLSALGAAPLPCPCPPTGAVPQKRTDSLGVASCSTSSCHGGPKGANHDVQSFAATIWVNDDPHSRAAEVLHEPRSLAMARLLGIGAPQRARQCLVCHATQDLNDAPLPSRVLADGVGCAACHGDPTHWESLHTLDGWRQLPPDDRKALGYVDLSTPLARVRTCLLCHVGDANHEVNHDLVAAGHPRLTFEFAAYQRLEPRHWSPAGKAEATADFTERSWAVGQAATLEAVARLLEVRARRAVEEPVARWPEFAELDCASCHRPLGGPGLASRSVLPGALPGTPSWQPWQVAAGRLLGTQSADAAGVEANVIALRVLLAADWAGAEVEGLDRVRRQAGSLAAAAGRLSEQLSQGPRINLQGTPAAVETMVANSPRDWQSWDSAVQTYLALEAARQGGPARLGSAGCRLPQGSRSGPALDTLRRSLQLPDGSNTPRDFDPRRFHSLRSEVP